MIEFSSSNSKGRCTVHLANTTSAPVFAPTVRIQARVKTQVRAFVVGDERLGVVDEKGSFRRRRFPIRIDSPQFFDGRRVLLDVESLERIPWIDGSPALHAHRSVGRSDCSSPN